MPDSGSGTDSNDGGPNEAGPSDAGASRWPDPRLADELVGVLRTAGRSLATCESLTGGLLGAAITTVPGASAVYRGGLITYATEVKELLARVPGATLAADGAVSAATAQQLALAALAGCRATTALALTGVAGPEPQEGKPAGTVWLGWAWMPESAGEAQVAAELLPLTAQQRASRDSVRKAAVEAALARLLTLCRSAAESDR